MIVLIPIAEQGCSDVKSVLLTGGAGYIGSHTAKALSQAGYLPVVLDNLSTGHVGMVSWGPFIKGDVGDRALLKDLFKQHPIEAVVHFAADKFVEESVANPRKYFENNVGQTLALLGEMLEAGVKRIVFSSTAAVYGNPETVPITESHRLDPQNPYAESKAQIERVLEWYGRAHGLEWLTLRYFNAAGADVGGEIGSLQKPATHLIQIVIEAARGERSAVEILGTDYDTHDGTGVRDFVHVGDLAEAHVLGLGHLIAGGASAILNLGSGTGHSVREVIAAVEKISGSSIATHDGARRPGDIANSIASAERAKEVLGWRPRFTELEEIVGSAWNWEISKAA